MNAKILVVGMMILALVACKKPTVQPQVKDKPATATKSTDKSEEKSAQIKKENQPEQSLKLSVDESKAEQAPTNKQVSDAAKLPKEGDANKASGDQIKQSAGRPDYQTAKNNFSYGPGRPMPRLVLPPFNKPGLLADARDPVDPNLPCGTEMAAAPLDLGPKENWASKKVKQAALGAFGKLFGGGGGGGFFGSEGGGDFDDDNTPPTAKDPIPKSLRQKFHDASSDTDFSISGRVNEEGLLLSTRINDAPDKSTFHHIYIEDRQCRRSFPDKFLNYKLWLEWSLSVTWSKTSKHYENDKLTSQKSESGSHFSSGTTDLGQGQINLADMTGADQYQQQLLSEMPAPIWRRMGFSSPEAGVRGLGSRFSKVTPAQLAKGDSIAVVHVTRVVDGHYVTRGLPFKMAPGSDGFIKFSRL
ncbi:MAG: hypothetical protein V7739_00095 [Motiliproteus sp.]